MSEPGRRPDSPSFPVAPARTIVGGEGSYLHTHDGRRILDGAGGAIVANIGHGRAEVADAVARGDAAHGLRRPAVADTEPAAHWSTGCATTGCPPGSTTCSSRAAAASRPTRRSGWPAPTTWPRAGPTGGRWSGATRATTASRVGAIAAASHSTRRAGYEPLLLDFPKVPWDDAEAVLKVIEQEDPATIAGFIFEPITGAAGGCLSASDEYWRTVERDLQASTTSCSSPTR